MRIDLPTYKCDRCGETYVGKTPSDAPATWLHLQTHSFSSMGHLNPAKDLCDDCAVELKAFMACCHVSIPDCSHEPT